MRASIITDSELSSWMKVGPPDFSVAIIDDGQLSLDFLRSIHGDGTSHHDLLVLLSAPDGTPHNSASAAQLHADALAVLRPNMVVCRCLSASGLEVARTHGLDGRIVFYPAQVRGRDDRAIELPAPLVFVKLSGRLTAPVDEDSRRRLAAIASEVATKQCRNLVLFLGSSPYAKSLARRLNLGRMPDWFDPSSCRDHLEDFQRQIRCAIQEATEILRTAGIPAVGIVGSEVAASRNGHTFLTTPGVRSIRGLLNMGAVPLIAAGVLPDEPSRAAIPSVDEMAVRLAEHLCPDLAIVSAPTDGVYDPRGSLIRRFLAGDGVVNLDPTAVTAGVAESVPYYCGLARTSLRVMIVNAATPDRIGRALAGDREVTCTEILADRPETVPVPRTGYSTVFSHQELLADRVRVAAFRQAILRAGVAGKRVVDFGTGSGILAAMAAEFGAADVVAIERDQIAEATRAMATLWSRYRTIRVVRSGEVPSALFDGAKADVIVSETVGSFGVNTHALDALISLRDEILAPGGKMVPRRLHLFLVPAWSGGVGARTSFFERWYLGWPTTQLRALICNQPFLSRVEGASALSEPAEVHRIDLLVDRTLSFAWQGRFDLRARAEGRSAGVVNCLAGWVRLDLGEGVFLDTSPWAPTTSWYQVVFPLIEPINTEEAAALEVSLEFTQSAGLHLWHWGVRADADGAVLVKTRQSGSQSFPLAPEVVTNTPYAALDWAVWRV